MRGEKQKGGPAYPSKKPGTPHAITGISRSTQDKLAKLGIATPLDLVLHLPLRYEDETRLYPIRDAPTGQTVQVEGVVVNTEIQYRPRRTLVCQVEDGTGPLVMRFFNFYGSQVKALAPGARVRVLGEIRQGFFGAEMVHPKYRIVRGDMPLPDSLTPVYPTTAGLSQDTLRKLIKHSLAENDLAESLPRQILQAFKLPGFRESVLFLHQPPPRVKLPQLAQRDHPAWRRIKFDELLAQQLSMRLHYRERRSRVATALPKRGQLTRALHQGLPFVLTAAQRRAMEEIADDLSQPYPMQRLLQGDVGSGKTIVAAFAVLQAIESGCQAAIMAPTEILAEQHYHKFSGWLVPLGIRVVWLAGSLSKKQKQVALKSVLQSEATLVIGTHALIQQQVEFRKLGLAIIDEQHRFGVHQRLALRIKGSRPGLQPHQLMMSATPIPRTLSMSYYADLDVSVIDELPPGRVPVTTKLVADSRRAEVVARVRDACVAGKQAYWVCPLIEGTLSPTSPPLGESDNVPLSRRERGKGEGAEALQLKTALETYSVLKSTFPELKIGLVHGRLASQEKAAVMQAFQQDEIQLLVATTVIEVGVDVPNASLMVIEHAERMGLSQLHQLRGRVGRGEQNSVCILMYQKPLGETARARLKIIFEINDGFEIARQDLLLRGPGEFLGARQSGTPLLRFADLNSDTDLLEAARNAAARMLTEFPQAVNAHLARWLGGRKDYLRV
ncbi:MAG TPA: ATP-dependent DNA helicase RecG [Burkholderiales bacterium]|nr:ATP-dependent DNA helicase RecG [Burkholderiales bacterium]